MKEWMKERCPDVRERGCHAEGAYPFFWNRTIISNRVINFTNTSHKAEKYNDNDVARVIATVTSLRMHFADEQELGRYLVSNTPQAKIRAYLWLAPEFPYPWTNEHKSGSQNRFINWPQLQHPQLLLIVSYC